MVIKQEIIKQYVGSFEIIDSNDVEEMNNKEKKRGMACY